MLEGPGREEGTAVDLLFPRRLQAARLATSAMHRARSANRRTLDALGARIAFYFALAHERLGAGAAARGPLLDAHRAACARHDEAGQEVLLNLLLRNYLAAGLVDAAEALRAKAPRPDPPRSPQEFARHLFYLGVIRASRLEYSDARDALLQASRKVGEAGRERVARAAHRWPPPTTLPPAAGPHRRPRLPRGRR